MMNKCDIGSSTLPSRYNLWYLYISTVDSPFLSLATLNNLCLLLSSLSIDYILLFISLASKLVIVPTRCGNFLPEFAFSKAPARPPPL